MEIRPIHTKKEYLAALSKIEKLWNAPSKSLEGDRLEVLTLLVEQYEKVHYPIQDPDPIQFIEQVMENRGLTRKDLEPMIGARGRVSDILNRSRPLTLEMIRKLVDQLHLPAEILVKSYVLRETLAA
jgi:HTH-type transcriptional regulator/antitoxin HigA